MVQWSYSFLSYEENQWPGEPLVEVGQEAQPVMTSTNVSQDLRVAMPGIELFPDGL